MNNTNLNPPREGSPTHLALQAIAAAGGSMDEEALSVALDLSREEVGQKLGYAIRTNVIRRSVFAGGSIYRAGEAAPPGMALTLKGDPKQPPVISVGSAPPAAPAAPPAQDAAWRVDKTAVKSDGNVLYGFGPNNDPVPATAAEAPSHCEPARRTRRTFPASGLGKELAIPRFIDRGTGTDLAEVVAEAAGAKDPAVAASTRPATPTSARELIASVLHLLAVESIELARYTDGRVLLEIDGVSCILSPALADKARAFFSEKTL